MKICGTHIDACFNTEIFRPRGNAAGTIAGFAIDTRKIRAGEIFIALKTENRDGHDFLEIARERGAVGAIVARNVPEVALPQIVVKDTLNALQNLARAWRMRVAGTIVGVTGSVGKTSTKDLLRLIFSAYGATHATFSNLNNTLGVPLTILGADSESNLIVEAGMSVSGELECSASIIVPDIAVITNVKPAHLAGLGSMENIAREKSALARLLSPSGIAIFPADLLRYESFKNLRVPRIALVRNAEERALGEAEKRADTAGTLALSEAEITEAQDGFSINFAMLPENFDANCAGTEPSPARFFIPCASRGLAENAALAILAAKRAGIAHTTLAQALATWIPSEKRGELRVFDDGRRFFVDCYNASPASILDSADAFVRKTAGTPARLFVLGGVNELGTDSPKFHQEVGKNLPLDAGTDTLATFGGDAAFYGAGARERDFPAEKIFNFDAIEPLKNFVADFRGDVMVKASRTFALERIVPAE